MTASAAEAAFQNDIIREMVERGWVKGDAKGYHRESALYPEDCLSFVKNSQPKMWEKFVGQNPKDPEGVFLDRLTAQLAKTDPNASDQHLRQFGTLGVLRHGLRDKNCHFKLCQFKPDHGLNPDTLTQDDMLNYAMTVRDKIRENAAVMTQIENNSPDQAMLGDFANALDDAVMDSSEAHQNQMKQVLNSKEVAAGFGRIVFELLVAQMKSAQGLEGPPSSRRGGSITCEHMHESYWVDGLGAVRGLKGRLPLEGLHVVSRMSSDGEWRLWVMSQDFIDINASSQGSLFGERE